MSELKERLCNGAKEYYAYLSSHNLGLSEVPISSSTLQESVLVLSLRGNVADMDLKLSAALILEVDSTHYMIADGEGIELQFYDERQKVIYLALDSTLIGHINKNLKKLRLFSDLKFLVKNVEEFFENFGDRLRLPTKLQSPHTKSSAISPIPTLSDEQNNALKMVLSEPLSYVWGPPGTGKTQKVLFEALLHYMRQGKKVAVVTTTNNALEQVLVTLIRQFDELGLERSSILRLGTPTMGYMNAYWQTCDPSLLQQKGASNLFNFQDTLKTRLKTACVVGVTLDGFIKRYESLELSFSHIFLDECAYAPLIKTCALCVEGTPLALFGDHKQLSPVCEMPKNALLQKENENAFVWNLSALFLESFFNGDMPKKLAQEYERSGNIPSFKQMCCVGLSRTHRYGDNLAQILDKYVYHMGLRGKDEPMEIFAIDSGAKQEGETQISQSEVMVCEILSTKLKASEYAIITPFVKQRQKLGFRIPRDRIFTIHGSQGQEFDNVVFSPVSLHYHLTNSHQTHALYALNVAISRVKKRLFIVCDYAFWSRQKGQLLYAILQQAKFITLEDIL